MQMNDLVWLSPYNFKIEFNNLQDLHCHMSVQSLTAYHACAETNSKEPSRRGQIAAGILLVCRAPAAHLPCSPGAFPPFNSTPCLLSSRGKKDQPPPTHMMGIICFSHEPGHDVCRPVKMYCLTRIVSFASDTRACANEIPCT